MVEPAAMIAGQYIGIDLGGTNVRAGLVRDGLIEKIVSHRLDKTGTAADIIQQIFHVADELSNSEVQAIGIGVPGLVNQDTGIVFDVLNIASWQDMPLRHLVEERYQVPVWVNNDANCFALGEYYFGKGIQGGSLVGLTIGTGLGSGIILNGKLYSGKYCGAGEFGMIDYLDHYVEYYASGQFFENVYHIDGEQVFKKANEGDVRSQEMYAEMGTHLGNAIKTILYALEVDQIILGGSVRHAYPFFERAMWQRIHTFAYKQTIEKLKLELSTLDNSGILGAAALHFDSLQK
jgi:glucokinase